MKAFFFPRGVAVFGVSESKTNLGRIIVENLQRFGFAGAIVPIGARSGSIAGLEIRNRLPEAGDPLDLAVLLIPAADVPGALEACGRRGIRSAIIESGGFSEFMPEAGARLEEKIVATIRRFGMRIVGPNCFGIINRDNGLVLPFFVLQPAYLPGGRSSLISQSGGIVYDTCMLSSVEQAGISKIVSVGNKLDIDENDVLEYLIGDKATGVIGLYLENFSDGRRLMELAAATEKPVVVLKGNRSPAGREIARFHTAALAGDDAVAGEALQQAGITRAKTFPEMIRAFKVFSLPPMRGDRVAIVSRSGGHGVLGADAAHDEGFVLSRLSQTFFDALKTRKRNVISATNPVDVGDVYNLGHYGEILDLLLREPEVDGVIFVCTFSSETDGHHMEAFLRHAWASANSAEKPVVVALVTNRDRWFHLRETSRMPVFVDVAEACKALALSRTHYGISTERRRALRDSWKGLSKREATGDVRRRRLLPPSEAFSLLAQYGLPVVPYAVADEAAEVTALAARLGYPVALKTARPEVLHKTERGGVVLGIDSGEKLINALMKMEGPPFLLQKMAPEGLEVIIGGKRDPQFGPAVLFGLGGVFVEALRQTSLRVAPLSELTAREMVEDVAGAIVLKGFRGGAPRDVAVLCQAIAAVSRLFTENDHVLNVDLNPLIVYEAGRGCLLVDARIEVEEGA